MKQVQGYGQTPTRRFLRILKIMDNCCRISVKAVFSLVVAGARASAGAGEPVAADPLRVLEP
jgi:hypothetical protein